MKQSWIRFFDEVRSEKIERAYLFSGPELYVQAQAQALLREKILPPGLEPLNETVLEAPDAQAIIEACETLPFMAKQRLVLVRDFAPMLAGRSKNEADEAERLEKWLPGAPESCCLVFLARGGFDLRKKAVLAVAKHGVQVNFDYLDDARLGKWLADAAKREGARIDPDACAHLSFLAGRALMRLSGEMHKLCAYVGEGGRITKETVELLVPPSPETTVFQMIDALMAKQTARALALYKTMLQSGESRIGILALLTRQMRLLTYMRLSLDAGESLPGIEQKLSLNHFAAMNFQRQARAIEAKTAESAYRACIETDYQIKSGRAREESALDSLLIRLSNL